MKKLLLVFGVLFGMVFSSDSFALNARDSSLKTFMNNPLVSSVANGNTAFITTATYTDQFCASANPGSGITYGALLACGPTAITGIALSAGATGNFVTIYDANTNIPGPAPTGSLGTGVALPGGEVGVQEVVFETFVAANTGAYYDLSNAPIYTTNGVVAYTGTTGSAGVVVYTSKQIAINQ